MEFQLKVGKQIVFKLRFAFYLEIQFQWYLVTNFLSRMGNDRNDHELAKLSKVLEKLSKKNDVRKYIK